MDEEASDKMAFQTVFKRYEIKYMITREQKDKLIQVMRLHMKPDSYGRSEIRNVYYDTDSYRLIRRSIEKPVYKEKLRIRSYGKADCDDTVFVELKKKYKSVVYKRRLAMTEREATEWMRTGNVPGKHSQIEQEIEYFRSYYEGLRPAMFLSYEREAFYSQDGSDLRVTFDDSILARTDGLSLRQDTGGTPLLDSDSVLMEIKTSGGIPLWMTSFLTQNELYKTSFSKYGTAYTELILKKGELLCVC